MTLASVSICPGTLQTQAGVRFLSVCSGIEAASVAWEPLGWRALAFSEIEPFPSAVLAHHYPSVPNLGDMTTLPEKIRDGVIDAPEILCGGTPCQAFSVAGLRRSLEDDRGNLSLTFCEIANAIDAVRAIRGAPPSVVFWENVPGVLSTKDNAFGCFLAGLAGEDLPLEPPGGKWTDAGCVHGPARTVAWRTLDAQYFGLAQRRRRVFVVSSARDQFDPAAVLFEWEGVRRDSAPSRETGEGVAAGFVPGLAGSVEEGALLPVAHSLRGEGFDASEDGTGRGTPLVPVHAFDARQSDVIQYGDKTGPLDTDGHTIGVAIGTDCYNGAITGDVAATLGTGSGSGVAAGPSVMQPVAFDTTQITSAANYSNPKPGDPLAAGAHAPAVAVTAMRESGQGYWMQDDIAGTLRAEGEDRPSRPSHVIQQPAMQVRRLTPRECERLQGFPDDYTLIPWRNKPASECPDGPRYKALGNSWAVPVVRWIGERIHRELRGELRPET